MEAVMLGDCHVHVIMDGKNYKEAVALHKGGVGGSLAHENISVGFRILLSRGGEYLIHSLVGIVQCGGSFAVVGGPGCGVGKTHKLNILSFFGVENQ
jgi:hypothetical protein